MAVSYESETKLPMKHRYDGDYSTALAELRSGINHIDEQLISLIAERFIKVSEVGDLKAIFHLPVEDLQREKLVLERAIGHAKKNGLSEFLTRDLMKMLMKHAKLVQAKRIRRL